MADIPIALADVLGDEWTTIVDVEGKIPRAIDAIAPLSGRDVLLVGRTDGRARQLAEFGARLTRTEGIAEAASLAAGSADTVVSLWTAFRGVDPADVAAADRLLRPDGRLVVVHDYGRDDVSRIRGEQPEYGSWSRRDGPFLGAGFRIHVVHCWWTFGSVEEARERLARAFGRAGEELGSTLHRPRLSWNVAIYHRVRGGRGDGG